MSHTLVIPDQLFESLDRAARSEGLRSVEDLLVKVSESLSGDDRLEAVAQIRFLRQRLKVKYGEMPDSTNLIREDRGSLSGIDGLAGKYEDDPTLSEISDEAYRLRDAERQDETAIRPQTTPTREL